MAGSSTPQTIPGAVGPDGNQVPHGELLEVLDMVGIALVGGQGTRMRPLTFRTPKPLLPLVQRPLIWYTVERCRAAGIGELILSTGYKTELFSEVLGHSCQGVELRYATEPEPLGTAGGAKNCERYVDDTFVVFNGDLLTSLELGPMIDFHRSTGAEATIFLTEVDDPSAYGVVPTKEDGSVIDFIEKPALDEAPTNYVNGGVYVLERSVLELIPGDMPFSFERDVFPSLLEKGRKVMGYKSECYWLDVGTPAKYLQAHADLMFGRLHVQPPGIERDGIFYLGEAEISSEAEVAGPVVLGDGVRIGPEVSIKGPASIGPRTVLEGPTELTRVVLLGNDRVGAGCRVEDAILGEDVEVERDCVVAELAVVGSGAVIRAGNELRRGMRVWPDVEVSESSIKF